MKRKVQNKNPPQTEYWQWPLVDAPPLPGAEQEQPSRGLLSPRPIPNDSRILCNLANII